MNIELSQHGDDFRKAKIISLDINPSLQTISAIVALVAVSLEAFLHDHCHAEALGVEPAKIEELEIALTK